MGTAAAVAMMMRKEQDIVRAFQRRDVTDAARAVTLESVDVHAGVALRRLQRQAVIRAVGDDRYYLDEPSLAANRWTRRLTLSLVLLVMMELILIAFLMFAPHA
ncbi:MAG TPA: hypothetical protein VGM77_00945 [Gemmatimonadales bacterium]|jgi:hypothetical protein